MALKALDFDQLHYIQYKYICFAFRNQKESLKPVIIYITPSHDAISAWPPNSAHYVEVTWLKITN